MEPDLLETLIKRYEAGERDPELIQALDEAAWDGFHDPWEQPVDDLDEPDEAPWDPQEVRPFGLETIDRHLEANCLDGWRTDGPMRLVFLGYDRPSDRSLEVMHVVEGEQGTVYCLRMVGDRRVDAADYQRARELCDRWNGNYRWPRAFLEIPGREGEEPAASGLLTLDYQLQLAAGIHQALFDELVRGTVAAAYDFWKLAREAGL